MCPPNRYIGYEFLAFVVVYAGVMLAYGCYLTAKARRACVDPDRYDNFWLLFNVTRVGFSRASDEVWFAFPVDERDRPVLTRYRRQGHRAAMISLFVGFAIFVAVAC
jgi:hypothetical protein